jgi:hypothetical protein
VGGAPARFSTFIFTSCRCQQSTKKNYRYQLILDLDIIYYWLILDLDILDPSTYFGFGYCMLYVIVVLALATSNRGLWALRY